jgi:translation initiation factor IF-2
MKSVEMPSSLTVKELAEMLNKTPVEIIKQLMRSGVMANVNQVLDHDVASATALALGYEVKPSSPSESPSVRSKAEGDNLSPRPPVVTVMGHVDHGKTTLLDHIRKTNIASREVGGITQHIGAYQVEIDGNKITFIDTPGHMAFTQMRARGAKITDIVVLVVAADDGVMPQTIEAIDHARLAQVPIMVAINKMDKPDADPDRVKRELSEQGLVIEEWGGDIMCIPISAKKGEGISGLLESILVLAEVLELKADPKVLARGVAIEGGVDKLRGPVATLLVQEGELKVGDTIVCGGGWGRIKAMLNDQGKRVKRAEPATPVEILGLDSPPQAGDAFSMVKDEKEARLKSQKKEKEFPRTQVITSPEARDLNIVLKTDVEGSIEPIKSSLEELSNDKVLLRVIYARSGIITEGDVLLARASNGMIVGFNTSPGVGIKKLAEREGVDIHLSEVIYKLMDEMGMVIQGMLEPEFIDVVGGIGEVREVFSSAKGKKVAGVYVLEESLKRGARVRVMREGEEICESTIVSLRRFKDDVREVETGFECGVGIGDFSKFKVGDRIESHVRRKKDESTYQEAGITVPRNDKRPSHS